MPTENRNWDEEEEAIINFAPKPRNQEPFAPLPFPEEALGLEARTQPPKPDETKGIRFNDSAPLAAIPAVTGFPPIPGRSPSGMPPLPGSVYPRTYPPQNTPYQALPPVESLLTTPPEPRSSPEKESVFPDAESLLKEETESGAYQVELANDSLPLVEIPTPQTALDLPSPFREIPIPQAGFDISPPAQTHSNEPDAPSSIPPIMPVPSLPTTHSNRLDVLADAPEISSSPAVALDQELVAAPEHSPDTVSQKRNLIPREELDVIDPPTIMDVPLLLQKEMQQMAQTNPVMPIPPPELAAPKMSVPEEFRTETIDKLQIPPLDLEAVPEVGMLVVMRTPSVKLYQIFRIENIRMELGRSFDAAIFIDDRAVSMRHAAVRYERRGEQFEFVLYDLASTNGTFLNGQRVSSSVLKDNDKIELGESELIFKRVIS